MQFNVQTQPTFRFCVSISRGAGPEALFQQRRAGSSWSRRTIGTVVLVMAKAFALPALNRDSAGSFEAYAQTREYKATCAPWDVAASEAIVQLVQGKPDMDLRQVSDAVVRMRRARRLCESGWVRLACLDYDAVIRGAPSLEQFTSVPSMCWPAVLDPPAGVMTRW